MRKWEISSSSGSRCNQLTKRLPPLPTTLPESFCFNILQHEEPSWAAFVFIKSPHICKSLHFYDHLFIFCFPGYRVEFNFRSSVFFLYLFIQSDFYYLSFFNSWKNTAPENTPFWVIAASFSYRTSIFPILSSMSLFSLPQLPTSPILLESDVPIFLQ